MAQTGKFDQDPMGWVGLAASRDMARPTLCAVWVQDGGRTIVATDSHRLHVVEFADPCGWQDGPYNVKTRSPERDLGPFPNWRPLLPADAPQFSVDPEHVRAISAAAIAYGKVLGSAITAHPHELVSFATADAEKRSLVRGLYVADAISGLTRRYVPQPVALYCVNGLAPLYFRASFGGQLGTWTALIMPVRQNGANHAAEVRFAVDSDPVAAVATA